MEQQPLLSESRDGDNWSTYQSLGRSAPVHVPSSTVGGEEVSAEDVRSASLFSDRYYPPSLHGALVSSPEPDAPYDQALVSQGGYDNHAGGYASQEYGRHVLDEVEIRQLLIEHIGHHCCWRSRPARRWKITAIEDCNVYVGTLEAFIEEREIVRVTEPYMGGEVDGSNKGPVQGLWELDLRSKFPLLFAQHQETRVKIPHSEATEKCSGCEGRGTIPCPACNAGQEPGFYKENQMTKCHACYGRGLIAHQDGSDTLCTTCSGQGLLPCIACGSRGSVKCQSCGGQGSLLTHGVALVKWKTLANRKVSAASGAASVPEEVFHRARGVQLHNTQAYQCTPAYFADSYLLNRFSSDVIAERTPIPPAARIICERHTISVIPVTRVTMVHRNRSFSFYIIGVSREVFIRDYPSKFCSGLCCCFEWLSG